jgi:uncharacterized HAD superfamily protein
VLCHAARHFLRIVEREFGKRVAFEALCDFDVGRACGLLPDESERLYRIVHEPGELLAMAPIPEALEALARWSETGHEIAIVTGRPPQAREASLEWLARHRVVHHSFTMVDKYGRFEPSGSCAIGLEQLAERDYAWAVEDSLPMARYLAGRMGVHVALLDAPWNRTASPPARVTRYAGWNELAQAVPG